MITELWLTPLILLPGVALLIMSTSLRYGQIHGEIHHLLEHKDHVSKRAASHLLKRATLFRNALVSLYISVGLFSSAGLLGGLASIWTQRSNSIVTGLTCLGILSLVFASVQLIRESFLSLEIIKEHSKQIETDGEMSK